MKKIFTLFFLTAAIFATAQEADTMYVYKGGNIVQRIPVSGIDSVTFALPVVPEGPLTPVVPPVQSEYEYVDLGLPSGIMWATCNVGATKPEEYGGYYAWGETSTKSEYNDGNYKWESLSKTTKYCLYSNHGEFDGKMHLEPGDDVANVKWGGSWRMPLKDDMNELRYYCTWEWTSLNGVEGCRVTGPNGNSIFLPAAGMCWQYGHTNEGKLCYWIGTVLEYRGEYSECAYAYCLSFGSDTAHRMSADGRYRARTVRPVTE